MGRTTDAIITANQGLATFATSPMMNLGNSGQQAWAPDPSTWVSNQGLVNRPVIPLLLEAPRFFKLLPNPSLWVQYLKNLVETQAITIDGLNAGLEIETDTHAVGGAGELQDEVTDVKRTRTEPKFSFQERTGAPIQNLLDIWVRYAMMDPDTKYPLYNTLAGTKPTDNLPDWYTMTMLFIQLDGSGMIVFRSWLVTNMFPKGTIEITAKRDKTSAQELVKVEQDFAGITFSGMGINLFAQNLLKSINFVGANPQLRPAFLNAIDPDVLAAAGGMANNITGLGNSAVIKP